MRLLRHFIFLVVLAIIACLGAAIAGLGGLWYFGRNLPDYQQLADYEPPVTTRVHAGDGRLIAEFARERRLFVPIDAIPKLVEHAFISAEDKNFRSEEHTSELQSLMSISYAFFCLTK